VADQYLAQIRALPELDRDLLADFLYIAGRLLLLKSRALLLTEEPDPVAEEVAGDLTERLATYRVFRAAAEVLRGLEQRGERTYVSPREPLVNDAPPPLAPTPPEALLAVWRRFEAERQQHAQAVELPGLARASVDERRTQVLDALRIRGRVTFREVAGTTVDQVVATFLAVQELFRRGVIAVQQPHQFSDLEMSLLASGG
jgi:segregation and condensation protein A